MSQQELLTAVAAALDRIGIQYMVTGSIASSLYGEPRLSHDIDILLHVTAENAIRLAGAFPPPRFYLDPAEAIAEMVREESMFNLILSKLSWSMRAGGSEKQFRDALRVLEVQQGSLDVAYCERWAVELGVQELWERLRAEAGP